MKNLFFVVMLLAAIASGCADCGGGECTVDADCPGTLVCRGGKCAERCQDVQCDPGEVCVAGSCVPESCTATSCTNPPGDPSCYTLPAPCQGGVCRYTPEAGRVCDDGDPCTEQDSCRDGGSCAGTPRRCEDPPPPSCKDDLTLLVSTSPGSCASGQCSYSTVEVACPQGCANNQCAGDPCAGVTCTTPPLAQCVTEDMLRAYGTPGSCSNGVCSYPFDDTFCPAGCEDGACRGNPCAGVSCDQPPSDLCLDGDTLRDYQSPGVCQGGSCQYPYDEVACPNGCADGQCRGCIPDWIDVTQCSCTPTGCQGCSGTKDQSDGCGNTRTVACDLPATGCPAGQFCQNGVCAGCNPVSANPGADPWTVRAAGAGFGGIVTQPSGSFTDVFLKSPTDYIRIGTRLDWGGTVVFFGTTGGPNVIDANDTGREVQLSIYDRARLWQSCAFDASCGSYSQSPCGESITFLGWNPVQGGDECNRGASVLSYGQAGDALQLVVQPIHWNPEWATPDCRTSPCDQAPASLAGVNYVFELRFVSEHVVELATQVVSIEDLDHPEAGQEFPCLYASFGQGGPDLTLLLDSSRNAIDIPNPNPGQAGCVGFSSPGGWVTWQVAGQTYGVGLASDQGITDFYGCDGDGTTYPYFHYTRYNSHFPLGPRATVRGIAYLALGNTDTVEAEILSVLRRRPPFGWLDVPAAGADYTFSPGAPVPVAGWVLDTTAISDLTVEIDGTAAATVPVDAQRPDVCLVYPNYRGCPAVGFSGSVPTAGLNGCPHLLRVTATDGDGNRTVLGERVIAAGP